METNIVETCSAVRREARVAPFAPGVKRYTWKILQIQCLLMFYLPFEWFASMENVFLSATKAEPDSAVQWIFWSPCCREADARSGEPDHTCVSCSPIPADPEFIGQVLHGR